MTAVTTPSVADILVELHQRGIEVSVRGDYFSLRPKGKAPNWLKEIMRQLRTGLMDLLADPRRRWQEQAAALLATIADTALRKDLQLLFDEREAIAALDGGLDDHHAGRMAYETICNHLRDRS